MLTGPSAALAQPVLGLEMLTWHMIGLDSNNPVTQGPNEFLSGVRACNSGADTAANVTAHYVFDTANPYVGISPRGTDTLAIPSLEPGACEDFYFLLAITRTPLAFYTTRRFHIEVSADNHAMVSTPTPRELYVEKLVSQNRNVVLGVSGPTNVFVGQTATYTVNSKTATQGYEQLSSFLNFPNLLFRVLDVDVTYSVPAAGTNDRVYADACGWDEVPGPTPPAGTYRSCTGVGKAGGTVTTTYTLRFQSVGSATLNELIYDFSGSSYHYNSDFGAGGLTLNIGAPTPTLEITKRCSPDPVRPGTNVTCTIDYANSSTTSTLTGVELREEYDPRTTYVSAVPAPDNAPANDHWTIGTLAPGQAGRVVVTLQVDAGTSDGDALLNRVSIRDAVAAANDSPGDPPGSFASAEAPIHVADDAPATALLRVTKTGLPDPEVGAGSPIVYTIAYQNLGVATAYDVVLTDTLGDGLSFVSSVPAPSSSSPPVHAWNLGNLAPGASGSITVTAETDAGLPDGSLVVNGVLLQGQPGPGTLDSEGLTASAGEVQVVAQPEADLAIDKTDAGDPVPQGGEITYTITVTNNGPDTAPAVTVVDTLDPSTTFVSAGADCVEAPAGTLTCDLGDLADGEVASFTVTALVSATAPTAGTLQTGSCTNDASDDLCNVATVSSSATDPVSGNNTADEPTNVTALAAQCDLSVTKSDTSTTVLPGGQVVYTISVTNNGPDNAQNVVIHDQLDPNTTFVSETFPGTCAVEPGGIVACELQAVNSGQTRSGTITVDVAAGAPTAGSRESGACDGSEDLCNRIVSMTQTNCADPNPSNNTTDEPTDVARPSSDLSITKSDTGFDPASRGDLVTYTIAVSNAGPAAADDVVVTDTLDANTVFVSSTAPGGCTPVGADLECAVGTVANGATATFTVTVHVAATAPSSGTTTSGACASPGVDICNRATVASSSDDPDPSDDSAEQPTDVLPESADLRLEKSDAGADPVTEGNVFDYTLTVTNEGPDAANDVVVVDALDPGQYYLEDTAPAGCTQAPPGTVTCELGTLASGATVSFALRVFVPAGAATGGTLQTGPCDGSEDLCNTAVVSSTTPDPDPSDNADDEPTDVEPTQADLAILKSDGGSDPVEAGGTLTYTIRVFNDGPGDAQDVVVTDTLPAGTTLVGDNFGCVEAPAGTLTCSVGTVLAGLFEEISILVDVDPLAATGGTLSSGHCDGSEDLCNVASLTSSTADPTPGDHTDDEPTNVVPAGGADLSITKTDLDSPVQQGAFASYRLAVTNDGPDTATNVHVVDVLDADTTFVASTRPCVEAPPGTIDCALGDLASGASADFVVVVHVDPAAATAGSGSGSPCSGAEDLCNNATVSSDTSDPDSSDNQASAATDVVAAAVLSQLSLTKVDMTAEPVLPGDSVTYRITVENSGPATAADVVVYESLDAYMTYDSDTLPGGCVVTDAGDGATTGASLTCAIGDIAAGDSASFDIVVTLSASAPQGSVQQDGDCSGPEDVCNEAVVATSSADFTLADNRDSEPTDVGLPPGCGNGALDPGEECDPVSSEICNNGIDDDGDLLLDCGDPDCDIPGYRSCDGACQLTPPCLPILRDPAKVTDRVFYLHGQFVPTTPVDPEAEGFTFVLSNEFGEIYRGVLLPGDLRSLRQRGPKRPGRWKFKDYAAQTGAVGLRGGVFRVGIHERLDRAGGPTTYVFTFRAYGDFSGATVPRMTTQVYIGEDTAAITRDWIGGPGRWRLTQAIAAGN